jgi:hypothetical protein
MARDRLRFLPEHFVSSNRSRAFTGLRRRAFGSALLKIAGLSLLAALAIALPSFAQRGGGGGGSAGGGGGSHGGSFGSASSGGSHFGGGGGGHWGGGASTHSGASRGGVDFYGSAGNPDGRPHATGIRAAFLRFFGFGDAWGSRESEIGTRTDLFVRRAVESAKLPPVFSRIRLSEFPAAFNPAGSTATRRASMAEGLEFDRRQPLPPPRPRGLPPVFYGGGYGLYGPELGFGFPLFFDSFDYFDYFDWFPSWQYNVRAAPAMLLYLKDGSAVEVTDYWVEGVNLRYVTDDNKEGSVPVANVDIKRTTDANARAGFRFTLDRTHRGMPLDPIEPAIPPNRPDQSSAATPPQPSKPSVPQHS